MNILKINENPTPDAEKEMVTLKMPRHLSRK